MDTEKLQKLREEAAEQAAARYDSPKSKYHKYMKALENSPLNKVRPHGVTAIDKATLGKQLEQWDTYVKLVEDDGNIASLGTYPNVALDALTVTFGASPINVIASVQPIEEVQGLVYFRNFVAQNTRGNVTAGQNILSSLQAPDVFPQGYASDTVMSTTFINDSSPSGATYSNVALAGSADFGSPINPQTIVLSGTVTFSAGICAFAGISPNPSTGAFSQVVEAGSSGTYHSVRGVVNFSNGQVTLTFDATPTNTVMVAKYQTIEEDNTDLQKAILVLQSKQVLARFFSLKSTIGLAETYMLRKRFGISAEEEIARDLTVSINNEIVNTAVNLISSNIPSANTTVSWTRQPESGVSYFEHQQTLRNAMVDASAQIVASAGRGAVNCWIVGREAAAILEVLPGFNKLFDDLTFGPHIYGSYMGTTVVRVPYSSVLDDNTMLGICKGQNPFEAPIVFAPYMPLVVTNTLPMAYNPLQQQRAAAVWAAIDTLVPSLSTQLTILELDFNYGAA
jgi:hypothetical protein